MRRTMLGLAGILLAIGLVACGEAPTATPVPTPTPQPSPTAAATATARPTVAGTVQPGAGTAVVSTGGGLPVPAGAALIQIDSATVETLLKAASLPPDLARSVKFSLYASDDGADKAADDYNKLLTGAGYVSSIPGLGGTFIKQGEQYFGFLSQSDNEALVVVQPLTADFTNAAGAAGIAADIVKNVTAQLQGKKSVIIAISGKGLLQIFSGGANLRSSSTTPTPTR